MADMKKNKKADEEKREQSKISDDNGTQQRGGSDSRDSVHNHSAL